MIPAGFTVATYSSEKEPPARRWVAIINRPGTKGSLHLASFTYAATEEEANRKAADAIESWINPVKKHKQPADLDTVPPALEEEEPI